MLKSASPGLQSRCCDCCKVASVAEKLISARVKGTCRTSHSFGPSAAKSASRASGTASRLIQRSSNWYGLPSEKCMQTRWRTSAPAGRLIRARRKSGGATISDRTSA